MVRNPIVITTNATGYDKDNRDYFQMNGKVDISNPWVSGLKLSLSAAADKYILRGKRWETPWTLYNWNKTSYLKLMALRQNLKKVSVPLLQIQG